MQASDIDPHAADSFGYGPRTSTVARVLVVAAILCSLTAIFSSSGYQARFPHGTVILPWQFPALAVGAFGGAGALLALAIAIAPQLYWPTLAMAATLTAGMFVLRFPVFDEWLIGCLLIGATIAIWRGAVRPRAALTHSGWMLLFAGLAAQLVIASLIGFFAWSNPKALRFTLLHSTMLATAVVLWRYEFLVPARDTLTRWLALAGIAYGALYIIHGLSFSEVMYVDIMEGIGGAAGGYSNVIDIVTIPAGLILIAWGASRGLRFVGATVLAMTLVIVALSDSRGGAAAFVGALLIASVALPRRQLVKLFVGGALVVVATGVLLFGRAAWIVDVSGALTSTLNVQGGTSTYDYHGRQVSVARGDAGRFVYMLAAVEALFTESPAYVLTGVGTYGYFPVAGWHYENIAARRGVPTVNVNYGASLGAVAEPPRPPAASTWIVETGLLGVSLLLGTMVCVGRAILRGCRWTQLRTRSSGTRLFVASSVGLALAWMYSGYVEDIALFYFLLMPNGLAHVWSGGVRVGGAPAALNLPAVLGSTG